VDLSLFFHVSFNGVHPLLGCFLVSFNWGFPVVNNFLFVSPVQVSFTSFFTHIDMSVFDLEFDGFGESFVDLHLFFHEFLVGLVNSSVWSSISL
jgi:hypothetical protein